MFFLIKYPQFPDVLNAVNVQPHKIFLLIVWHFSLCSWARHSRNCIQTVQYFVIEWNFSKQDPLWSGTTQNLQMFLVSLHSWCACPSAIYCTGQKHKLLYFHVFPPVIPPSVYNCCIIDHTHHLHKSCPSTLEQLCHHTSGTLTALLSSACFPFLGQTPISPALHISLFSLDCTS